MGDEIGNALKADLVLRGLDKERVEKDVSFALDTYGGKTYAKLKITGEYFIEAPVTQVEQQFCALQASVKAHADEHYGVVNCITTMRHHEFTLQCPSVSDVIKTINASLSSPDLHVNVPAQSQAR
jgi:hypothetical protein